MVSLNALPIGPNAFSPEILRSPWDDFRLSPGQHPDRAAEHAHDIPFLFRNTGNQEFMMKETGQPAQLLRFNLNWIYVSEAKTEETISAYEDRIKVLKIQAAQEGYVLNRASETTFLAFFGKNLFLRFGRLFLMENGNLRAVWKGENGAHRLPYCKMAVATQTILQRGQRCPLPRTLAPS